MADWSRFLALAQGLYFFVTGVWPLVSMRSFEAVTGPKTDDWLVKTVGVMIAVEGAVLLMAGYRAQISAEVVVLAVGGALGLMGIDLWYVGRKVISRIYLLDAVAELVLVVLWAVAWVWGR